MGVLLEVTGNNLLDSSVMTIVEQFGADAKVTALAIISVIVPASLGVWVIGLGIKKGLGRLMRMTKRAI